jgi:hypothetical protein
MRLEPYNPFDTGPKICFPSLEDGLAPGVGPESSDAAVVDIDFLSHTHPADIDTQHPPDLGYLPEETSLLLEGRCQAWFDIQCSLKAVRVGVEKQTAVPNFCPSACKAGLRFIARIGPHLLAYCPDMHLMLPYILHSGLVLGCSPAPTTSVPQHAKPGCDSSLASVPIC